jgi:uncharacterized membrane protein SirB2
MLQDLLFVTPALIIAAFGLISRAQYGYLLTTVMGGVLIFIGLLDVSFNAQNGGYRGNRMTVVINAIVNLGCLISGSLLVVYSWRNPC